MPKDFSEKISTIPSTKRGLKEGYNRVTFIVKEEIAYKLNCIASLDDVFLKEVVNIALETYVSEWEKKNSKIPSLKRK